VTTENFGERHARWVAIVQFAAKLLLAICGWWFILCAIPTWRNESIVTLPQLPSELVDTVAFPSSSQPTNGTNNLSSSSSSLSPSSSSFSSFTSVYDWTATVLPNPTQNLLVMITSQITISRVLFLFFAVNFLDTVVHLKEFKLNSSVTHHAMSFLCLFICLFIGPLLQYYLCATMVIESVAPFYQLLHLRRHTSIARFGAIIVNLLIRLPWWAWSFYRLSLERKLHHEGKDPDNLVVPVLYWTLHLMHCGFIGLDLLWTSRLLLPRGKKKEREVDDRHKGKKES